MSRAKLSDKCRQHHVDVTQSSNASRMIRIVRVVYKATISYRLHNDH